MQSIDKSYLSAIVLTLFPDMFPGPLGLSLAGTALKNGIWRLEAMDIRAFSTDKHRTVDDSPYGGGIGMVLKPDIVDAAVMAAIAKLHSKASPSGAAQAAGLNGPNPSPEVGGRPKPLIIYTSPRGRKFTQKLADELVAHKDLIIVCGRFEGLDQRVIDHHNMLEISIGDFVLSGGELAALTMLDACVRLLPGVIGNPGAISEESFSHYPGAQSASADAPAMSDAPCESRKILAGESKDYAGLLEYPHYTRPSLWKGMGVPEVLTSGNHEQIKAWRLEQAKTITQARRPDLLRKVNERSED